MKRQKLKWYVSRSSSLAKTVLQGRHCEGAKKKGKTKEAVGRQRQRVDRTGLSRDAEGCGRQTKMEAGGCKIIGAGVPMTLLICCFVRGIVIICQKKFALFFCPVLNTQEVKIIKSVHLLLFVRRGLHFESPALEMKSVVFCSASTGMCSFSCNGAGVSQTSSPSNW